MKAERAAGLLLMAASAALLSACDDGDDRRSNRGPSRSETREVGSFDSIDMQGAARLEITIGQPESLVIEGRASSIERVETDVRHNTLFIESKPRDWFMSNNRRRITLKITVPSLESLEVEGGNDVRLTGFDGGETASARPVPRTSWRTAVSTSSRCACPAPATAISAGSWPTRPR